MNAIATRVEAPAEVPLAPPSTKRGIATGVLAGTIGLGCCVGPAAAALVGLSSATYAFDLATDLYDDWGWAFKLAGAGFAGAAVYSARRKALACSTEKPRMGRFVATVAVVGVGTYAALFGLTTYLGEISS